MLITYRECVHFTLRTDHDALKRLFGPEMTSGKLARSRLQLQAFSFTVAHLGGKKKNDAGDMPALPLLE